jgi:hypothetical protein
MKQCPRTMDECHARRLFPHCQPYEVIICQDHPDYGKPIPERKMVWHKDGWVKETDEEYQERIGKETLDSEK